MLKQVFALTLLLAGSAGAVGVQQGAWEIGPYAGWGFLDKYNGLNPDDNLLYGGRFGYFLSEKVSFEPSFQWLHTDATGGNLDIQSLRFNMLYHFFASSRVNPFLTLGLGWEHTEADAGLNSEDLGFNGGAGLRIFITDHFAFRIDGRANYTEVSGGLDERQYNYEGTGGLSFIFGGAPPKDTDVDGVKDKNDTCPNTPTGATVDKKGCPSDADADSVLDGIDTCPDTIKGAKVDAKGCPTDTDGDGVYDGLDACENTLKGAQVDANGCSVDADGDGVPDNADKCPETPAGAPVDEAGCPLDSDADGVHDYKDQCENTGKGVRVDAKGCPLVTKARGVLKGVNFKFGKAELTAPSMKTLDGVAVALNEFPEVKVEVQGHTDSTGPVEANMKVSQARAEAVKDYLVKKGVAAERLTAKGYGPSKPMADNSTKVGRAKNRRVELNWLD